MRRAEALLEATPHLVAPYAVDDRALTRPRFVGAMGSTLPEALSLVEDLGTLHAVPAGRPVGAVPTYRGTGRTFP